MSPYATGGGGVTFERKVAVKYLAHLLVGDGASELGDGRSVVSVEFQQAPDHPVDDLVVTAAYALTNRCHRWCSPSGFGVHRISCSSDESTRKLIQQFVRAVIERANGRTGTPVGSRCRRTTTTRRATGESRRPRRGPDGRARLLRSRPHATQVRCWYSRETRSARETRETCAARPWCNRSRHSSGTATRVGAAQAAHRLYAATRIPGRDGLVGSDEQPHPGSAGFRSAGSVAASRSARRPCQRVFTAVRASQSQAAAT